MFFRSVTVGFYLKVFDNLGSLEIEWELFFKLDGIALSLGCSVVINIVWVSLFSRVQSRSNSFLSIFATCVIVFFNAFSWKLRSMIFFTQNFTVQQVVRFSWKYMSRSNKLSFRSTILQSYLEHFPASPPKIFS